MQKSAGKGRSGGERMSVEECSRLLWNVVVDDLISKLNEIKVMEITLPGENSTQR